jgi:hypothetical protein
MIPDSCLKATVTKHANFRAVPFLTESFNAFFFLIRNTLQQSSLCAIYPQQWINRCKSLFQEGTARNLKRWGMGAGPFPDATAVSYSHLIKNLYP